MHTRNLRELEHARTAPRRILNLTQKHGVNGVIEAIPSAPVAPNQVCTGFIYQHGSTGGGLTSVSLGIDQARVTGLLAAQPRLAAPLASAYGSGAVEDNWRAYDLNQQAKLERQSSPLRHGPGYLIHVWDVLTFAGSGSTTSLRDPQPTDIVPPRPTRVSKPGAQRPGPPPVDWSARFFYGVTGRADATGARRSAPTTTRATSPPTSGRIRGTIAFNFYPIGTTFLRN